VRIAHACGGHLADKDGRGARRYHAAVSGWISCASRRLAHKSIPKKKCKDGIFRKEICTALRSLPFLNIRSNRRTGTKKLV
jgi:hypothetical protein